MFQKQSDSNSELYKVCAGMSVCRCPTGKVSSPRKNVNATFQETGGCEKQLLGFGKQFLPPVNKITHCLHCVYQLPWKWTYLKYIIYHVACIYVNKNYWCTKLNMMLMISPIYSCLLSDLAIV